ncbi:hypothetical protein T439DRAFT_322648 [Meredithblackwellia eburnea MCA 4105]
MSTSLKAELKAWEAQFRKDNNGKDPSKNDIKKNTQIAEKYKLYAKQKSALSAPKSASTLASSTTQAVPPPVVQPPPAQLASSSFKSPKKPKQSGQLSSSGFASPSKNSTAASAGDGPNHPKYVIANSPSKLRALAASMSNYSPNTSTSSTTQNSNSSSHSHAAMAGGGITIVGSPKKYNPFRSVGAGECSHSPDVDDPLRLNPRARSSVSPKKLGKNLFANELMQLDKSKEERRSSFGLTGAMDGTIFASGAKGPNRTEAGSSASNVFMNDKAKEKRRARVSNEGDKMDLDNPSATEEEDEDDEVLGPSPVKPNPRGITKQFKPLFEADSLPPSSILSLSKVSNNSSSQPAPTVQPPKPKLFQGDVKQLRNVPAPPPPLRRSTSNASSSSVEPQTMASRGIKRPSGGLEPPVAAANKKSTPAANAKNAAPSAAKANGGTVSEGTKAAKPKRSKFRGMDDEDEEELDEDGMETQASILKRLEKGVLVVPLDDSASDGEGEESDAMDDDGGEDIKNPEGLEMEDKAKKDKKKVTTFVVRPVRPHYLKHSSSATAEQHNGPIRAVAGAGDTVGQEQLEEEDRGISTLPGELGSVLSLRSSPVKASKLRERERDLRVKRLLREPGLSHTRRGLTDLEEEDGGEESGGEGARDEDGSDDDWASDPEDGWADLGAGTMDEYDDERW